MTSKVGDYAERGVDLFEIYFGWLLIGINDLLRWATFELGSFLRALDPMLFMVLAFVISILITKRMILSLLIVAGFYVIYWMDYWISAMTTLNMTLIATFAAILVAIPLGIWAAKSERVNPIVKMLMDFMQTMPAFVYLIPAVIFFGLGVVPGVIATVIFALPPTVRLTNLGIRQVPVEMNEVADSFGSSGWQKLTKVQMPIAMPSIMAGVNQTIMLSLSMVVIAAMIGGGGLGGDIIRSLSRIDVGMGFEAGLAVVIIAMILDRLSQSFRSEN